MMERCGIEKSIVLNVLPSIEMIEAGLARLGPGLSPREYKEARSNLEKEMVERLKRLNTWSCELGHSTGRLIPFIAVQKLLGAEGMVAEVVRCHGLGGKGVKLQPGMNGYFPGDRALWPMYAKCQEIGFPIASDSGTYGRVSPCGGHYGEPDNFADVLKSFPNLTFVMCHFPSAYWDERVYLAREYPNLYFDISGGFAAPDLLARDGPRALHEEDAVRVMRSVGLDRFMFGTDGPSVMPQPWIEQTLRLSLTSEEKAMLLAENAARIYRLR
jgi:hypothetical protein